MQQSTKRKLSQSPSKVLKIYKNQVCFAWEYFLFVTKRLSSACSPLTELIQWKSTDRFGIREYLISMKAPLKVIAEADAYVERLIFEGRCLAIAIASLMHSDAVITVFTDSVLNPLPWPVFSPIPSGPQHAKIIGVDEHAEFMTISILQDAPRPVEILSRSESGFASGVYGKRSITTSQTFEREAIDHYRGVVTQTLKQPTREDSFPLAIFLSHHTFEPNLLKLIVSFL